MKKLMMMLAVAGLVSAPAWVLAADEPAAGAKPEHKAGMHGELKEMTVTGTIAKKEHKTHDGKTVPGFVLTDKDGNEVWLHSEPGADAAVDPAGFVGQNVTVVGMGSERPGSKIKMIRKITSIKKV